MYKNEPEIKGRYEDLTLKFEMTDYEPGIGFLQDVQFDIICKNNQIEKLKEIYIDHEISAEMLEDIFLEYPVDTHSDYGLAKLREYLTDDENDREYNKTFLKFKRFILSHDDDTVRKLFAKNSLSKYVDEYKYFIEMMSDKELEYPEEES